jgi:hypothetical protein
MIQLLACRLVVQQIGRYWLALNGPPVGVLSRGYST